MSKIHNDDNDNDDDNGNSISQGKIIMLYTVYKRPQQGPV